MQIVTRVIAMTILASTACLSQATEHSCPIVENLKVKQDQSIEISEQGISWSGWSDGENGAILSFIDATYVPDTEIKSRRPETSQRPSIGPVFCRYQSEYGSVLLYEHTPLNTEVTLSHKVRWVKSSSLQNAVRICSGPAINKCTFLIDSASSD